MWRQLTQRARKAVFLAHEEAERLGYNHVGSEHLLLALMREEDCVAIRILERLGIDPGTVRVETMKHLSRGSETLAEMQLAPDAKHAIDFAFSEVKQMKDDWVGTEHLLLGLVHEAGGIASSVLLGMGIDLLTVRDQLRQLKAGTLPFEGAPKNLTAVS
ncbi:MAG: Clp protease N-terminal domain-containing protein [Armatimonadota bacterium]